MTHELDILNKINRAKAMRSSWHISADEEPRLADMLADLMHLAAHEEIDFEHELRLATEFFGDERDPVECDNCDWSGQADDCQPIRNISERVAEGEVAPVGECPDCGCLAHNVD